MKVTGGQIYNAKPVLDKLVELPLSLKKAYDLSRSLKKIYEEFDFIENKRNEIIKDNCEPDPDKEGQYKVVEKKSTKLQEALKELTEMEFNIDIDIIDLSDVDFEKSDVKFSVKDAVAIEEFVKF